MKKDSYNHSDKQNLKKTKSFKGTTLFIVAVLLLSLSACSRSQAYRQDQEYFKQDTDYLSRKGVATTEAAKFGQPKKRIYVLDFINDTPFGTEELGGFIADELLRSLRDSGRAVVPENLKFSVRSDDFYSGDKVRVSILAREARKLGVSVIAIGKIKKIAYRKRADEIGLLRKKKSIAAVDLELRVFDSAEAKEILFLEKSADSTSNQLGLFGNGESQDPKAERLELVQMALRNAARSFSADFMRVLEKLSWEGQIAKVSGSKIYINAGRASGLNVGDILKVITTGEEIYDPATGSFLGKSIGVVKGTLEIVDYLGPDGSVAVVHSGGNFVENDVVQLY